MLRGIGAVMAGVLLLVAGCGTSERDEALSFHEATAEATAVVEAADLDFMVALLPVLRGEKFDAAQVKNAKDAIKSAVEAGRKRLLAATVPDTTSARALSAAATRFLERHEKAIGTDFAKALAAVENKDLDAAARVSQVRELFVKLQDAEYEDFAALRKAQSAFATEHHLTITEQKGDSALQFLTALGVANGRLEMGGKELGGVLRPAMDELPVKGDRVQQCLNRARDTLAAVRRIVDALPVPAGKSAKELADAEKAYLKRQDEIFGQYFPELLKLANDPLLIPESRKERVDSVLKEMQVAEEGPLTRLTMARDEFIRDNKLIRK